MNTRSIQFRLILWYSGLVIAVLLAFAYYTYLGLQKELYADMQHTLSRRAHQIASNMLARNLTPDALAEQIHSVYSPEANNRFIRIINADHSILYVSGSPQDGGFNPNEISVTERTVPASRIESLSYHNDLLITATHAQAGEHAYVIEMGAPTAEVEQTLHSLLMTLLYGLPFIILIVSSGGYMLVKRALQPVEDISAKAQEITFGNLSNRLPIATTGDALEHLSIMLNKMLDRLENAYEQASRFSADASHELRTPLTIMRGELEALVRTPELTELLQERVGSVLEETERLSRITESLFTISRLDAGEAKVEHASCDLAALAGATAEQMLLLAEEKQITLHIDAKRPVPVAGDAARLKQIVVNLLDNAIKYTPVHGNVWLSADSRADKALLEVRDNGIGIPDAALPHVFERFYRADKARSRDLGGAGLGLSIVRSICEAHGGTVEMRNNPDQGVTCSVELPLSINGTKES